MALVRRDAGKPVTPDSRAGERNSRPRRSRSSGQSPDALVGGWARPAEADTAGAGPLLLGGPPTIGIAQRKLDRWIGACYTHLLMGEGGTVRGSDGIGDRSVPSSEEISNA